ncbi:MAG: RNA methyltransferase substrate-binding domain-containing protein, partial [Polyangiales bacterium]
MTRALAGHRSVLEALRGQTTVRRVYVEADDRFPDIHNAASRMGVRIETRNRAELDKLSEGARHQGVVAVADPYHFWDLDDLVTHAGHRSILVALDEITDPQNLGAIIRSAVTLGTHGVIIPKHRAAAITPAVVRASAGATEHASIARVTNLQRSLLS